MLSGIARTALEASWDSLGTSRTALVASWDGLGASGTALRASWEAVQYRDLAGRLHALNLRLGGVGPTIKGGPPRGCSLVLLGAP